MMFYSDEMGLRTDVRALPERLGMRDCVCMRVKGLRLARE